MISNESEYLDALEQAEVFARRKGIPLVILTHVEDQDIFVPVIIGDAIERSEMIKEIVIKGLSENTDILETLFEKLEEK